MYIDPANDIGVFCREVMLFGAVIFEVVELDVLSIPIYSFSVIFV